MPGIGALALTEAKGTVDRFIPNIRGDTWVLLLMDGTEVHFPPHLSTELAAAVKPGGEVTVRGVRPHGDHVVAAVSLETSDGATINAREPRAPLFRRR
jgi:hypothetical protein